MFDKCIFFAINALARKINKIWEAEFKTIGLSPAHGYLLTLVIRQPGLRQKEIAEKLQLDPSTITRFIDALITKKLITRKNDDDARAACIFPTAKATAMEKDLEQIFTNIKQTASEKIGIKNMETLCCAIQECENKITCE